MRCRTAQQYLEAHADAALTARQHRAVSAHLAQCSRCQHAWQQRQQVQQLIKATSTPALPEGFAQRVTGAVRERAHTESENRLLRRFQWSFADDLWAWPTRLAAAAGLALGLLLGGVMGVTTPVSITGSSQVQRSQQAYPRAMDPATAYQLDALSGAPEGSLVSTYLEAGPNQQSQEAS